uniref:Putative secreted protein n=1 Tax=Ixodes scapularis TaxID=6945 RepID=A0A4D5RVC7_IXOSC
MSATQRAVGRFLSFLVSFHFEASRAVAEGGRPGTIGPVRAAGDVWHARRSASLYIMQRMARESLVALVESNASHSGEMALAICCSAHIVFVLEKSPPFSERAYSRRIYVVRHSHKLAEKFLFCVLRISNFFRLV